MTVQHESTKRFLPKIVLGFSVLTWAFFAVIAIAVFLMFVRFFWYYHTNDTCIENQCNQLATAFARYRSPLELQALLIQISFIVPTLTWMALGFWVFLARPNWLWSYVFSLFFLIGWYGEISIQYLRGSFYDAVVYTLGWLHLPVDPRVAEWSLYFRRIFKMLADNLGVVVIFSFPDGRFFPRWSVFYLGFFVLLAIGYSLPDLRQTFWNYNNWGFPYTFMMHLALVSGLAYAMIVRYRSSQANVRLQIRGVIIAMLANIVVTSSITYFQNLVMPVLFVTDVQIQLIRPWFHVLEKWLNGICMIWLAVAVAQAIVRQRLFDIRFVLNRAVAFGGLFLSSALVYGLIVGGLGSLFRQADLWLSILATGIIATTFHPMLIIFRQTANRLFYGERHDPYRAISNLGRRLEQTLNPQELAQTIVQTVSSTLKLPFVAMQTIGSSGQIQTVSIGEAVGTPLEFLLLVKGKSVGSLLVSNRFFGEAFRLSETRLLEDLASRAAIAVQEAQLAQELQASKEAIVLAREEERKRIRRDLHDGLGVTLTSLAMNLQVSRSFLTKDLSRADTLLESSAQSVQAAISDIRRLVYDLRPPALDDLGLEGALRQQLGQMLNIQTQAQIDPLEALPAAVEVAAYRIACEALNNAAKHAHAKLVKLRLQMAEHGLLLEITDDGIGFSETRASGVGLHSMRERSSELGGLFEIDHKHGGTRVLAWLPVRSEHG